MPIIKAKNEIDSLNPGDLLFRAGLKTSKTAIVKDQLTESGSDGKAVYIHVLERR